MSSELDNSFIRYLEELQLRDRGAMAALRHSLAFAPGDDPRAYPYVERFVGRDWSAGDARRIARYAVAGLFALYPEGHGRSLATAFGEFWKDNEGRSSLELRFVALLQADADTVMPHLRQAVTLLAGKKGGYNHAALLDDLGVLLNEWASPASRDRVRRQWARDFYRAAQPANVAAPVATA